MQKAIRISLAILLLFPLCGVFLSIHKCNGQIVSLGINESAVKCSMDEQKSCSNDNEITSKPCCETISIYNHIKLVKQELSILDGPHHWISMPKPILFFINRLNDYNSDVSSINLSPPIITSRPSLQVFRI